MHLRRAAMGIGLMACGLAVLCAQPARAGLIGAGTNTVNALFFLGSHVPGDQETEDFGSPPVAGPATMGAGGVNFVEGALSGSTIHVGDTSITITDLFPPSLPFCSVTTSPCPDSFTGFEFQFSPGVDITGVTVDPASAAAFRPIASGLSFSATDILVNLAGDAPAIGDQLILDLSFPGGSPPTIPEPATIALLMMAGLGLAIARHRRAA